MKFIIGNREEFVSFIDNIKKKNVAILTHTDLDGIASAIFIEEILKSKGLNKNVKLIKFLKYDKNVFLKIYSELKVKKIAVIFFSDLSPENVDLEGFERLRKDFSVFSIDHHPIGEIKDKKGIIKTETPYCTTHVIYDLGKGIIDSEKWKWLVYAGIISDMGYKSKEVLKFIQESFPEITEENIHESEIGKISSIVSSSLIYFNNKPEKVYDLIKGKKIKELEKYDIEVRKEIGNWMKKYMEKAEYFPERNLYLYYYNPHFHIASIVTTLLSSTNKDATFISISDSSDKPGFVSVSGRNQNSKENMMELMKKGTEGFENATAGGHIPAAGGSFMKKDLEKFKKNILNL